MESIEEIIRLREEAIQKLLEEKARLEAELETLTAKLDEISEQLQRLGYQATTTARSSGRPADETRKSRSTSPRVQSEHTIEHHLDGKRPLVVGLFHKLSEGIQELGEGVQELPRRNYIAYRTVQNFCEIVVQASKLWVYIDIAHSELRDPQDVAEDCSTVGHWATGDTRFDIRSQDEVEYAMSLIRQAYERSRQL